MTDWMTDQVLRLIANSQILAGEAGIQCFAVERLRWIALGLATLVLGKLGANVFAWRRLRKEAISGFFNGQSASMCPVYWLHGVPYSVRKVLGICTGISRSPTVRRIISEKAFSV